VKVSHKKLALILSIGMLMVWVFIMFSPQSPRIAAGAFLTATPSPTEPPVATPVSPADGTHTTDTTPHFYWDPIPGNPMTHYALDIDGIDSDYHRSWLCNNCTDLVAPEALPVGSYTWFINSSFGYPSASFTLYIDEAPTLTPSATLPPMAFPVAPADESHITETQPHFSWTTNFNSPSTYTVYVTSLDGMFSTSYGCTSCQDVVATSPLALGGYHWYVMTSFGYPSETFTFYIDAPATVTQTATPTCVAVATAPTLLSPAHRAHLSDTTPTFSWGNVPGAMSYRLTIYSEDRSFEYKRRVFNTSYALGTEDALSLGKYFWRVRAQDRLCVVWSGWSGRNTLFIE
jgi:hypothetical protein